MRNQIFDYFCVSICTNKTIMYSDDYNQAHNQEHMSEDVYSKPVRAGKRTYFFDVKTTRLKDDFYLTITESKRRQEKDGSFTYDKHKIFLYKEDFNKFIKALGEAVDYVKTDLMPDFDFDAFNHDENPDEAGNGGPVPHSSDVQEEVSAPAAAAPQESSIPDAPASTEEVDKW